MSVARRAVAGGGLVALATLALLAPVAAATSATPPRTSLPDVEPEVMCVVCGVPLAIAESPQADRERVFIRAAIARGETKDEIKRDLVAQYGPSVLATPSHHGFDLVAYLVPIAVAAALLALIVLLVPRWRRRGRAASAHATPPLSSGDAARLDDELGRFDG